ncbi:hypothetical protein IFM89_006765 [Coptis chinensis]|uniref:Uncharacterized protein n=1 Tax=Coptis chinensis TaxID=261450 RepID=A0A835I9F2_9MAGN|nr:hypothetical protein IFM89_006765 [Coptis chinensis]
MGDTTSVMILMLANNNFLGTIPKTISKIYRLLLLDLSQNKFSGNTFPSFGPDALLAYGDVSSNRLSDEVPVNFALETKILALGQNEFSAPLPQNLSSPSELEHLDLHNNNIIGE